jgi:hypothetical protein
MFETPLSPPSLLKFREGHRAPPCLIRYYGDDGKAILTAGVDRALRMTSVAGRSAKVRAAAFDDFHPRFSYPPGRRVPRAWCGPATPRHDEQTKTTPN